MAPKRPREYPEKARVRRTPWKHRLKIEVTVRIPPALFDRIVAICRVEGRMFPDVSGTLMLLGAGVWKRLAEHPKLTKDLQMGETAELMLLADVDRVLALGQLQVAEAESVVARCEDARTRERTEP